MTASSLGGTQCHSVRFSLIVGSDWKSQSAPACRRLPSAPRARRLPRVECTPRTSCTCILLAQLESQLHPEVARLLAAAPILTRGARDRSVELAPVMLQRAFEPKWACSGHRPSLRAVSQACRPTSRGAPAAAGAGASAGGASATAGAGASADGVGGSRCIGHTWPCRPPRGNRSDRTDRSWPQTATDFWPMDPAKAPRV